MEEIVNLKRLLRCATTFNQIYIGKESPSVAEQSETKYYQEEIEGILFMCKLKIENDRKKKTFFLIIHQSLADSVSTAQGHEIVS